MSSILRIILMNNLWNRIIAISMLCLLIPSSFDHSRLMSGSLLLSSILHPANAEFVDAMSTPSARLAWNNIITAESTGSDVSELISRFQVAIDLVQQAEDSHFRSCDSHSHCIESANAIFISVASDALLLESQSKQAAEQQMSFVAIASVIVAMPVAFFCLYIYKKREVYKLEKFYRMEIRLNEEV